MEIFADYLMEILAVLVSAFATWLGVTLKAMYTKHVNTQIKKDVVNTVVEAVEQVYKDLHGEEKLYKAVEAASEMLAAQSIPVTALELKMLIEAAVGSFNGVFYEEKEPVKVEGITVE